MNVFDQVRRLSKTQLKALGNIIEHKSLTSGATGERINLRGQALGGLMSSLTRNGLIRPIGKEEGKRTLEWELTPQVKIYQKELKELVDTILSLTST